MSAPIPCLIDGCFREATFKGRCQTHRLPAFAGNYRAERLPSDWKTRKAIVLKRDSPKDVQGNIVGTPICYLCGGPDADGVDHVEPNDDDSFSNLKAVHHNVEPRCHWTKTAHEGNSMREGLRPVPKGSVPNGRRNYLT